MIQTRKAQGRFVYQWRPKAKRVSYMVVVNRPYWLSFYAKDTKRVAWVVTAAYKSSCGRAGAARLLCDMAVRAEKEKLIGPIACADVIVVDYNDGCHVAERITKLAQS